MRDVGVELGPAFRVANRPVVALARSALIAVLGLQMVLRAALMAVARELAAGHCDERPVAAVDDLQIAHDETVVERDRAEGLQAVIGIPSRLLACFLTRSRPPESQPLAPRTPSLPAWPASGWQRA